jgi:hypothetical protein
MIGWEDRKNGLKQPIPAPAGEPERPDRQPPSLGWPQFRVAKQGRSLLDLGSAPASSARTISLPPGEKRAEVRTSRMRFLGLASVISMAVLVSSIVGMSGWAGLSEPAAEEAHTLHQPAGIEQPSEVYVASNVLTFWVSQAMLDLANDRQAWSTIQTKEELHALLKARKMTDLWYAMLYLEPRADQDVARARMVMHARGEPIDDVMGFKDTLSLIRGDRPNHSRPNWSNTEVQVITQENWNRDPREILELLVR